MAGQTLHHGATSQPEAGFSEGHTDLGHSSVPAKCPAACAGFSPDLPLKFRKRGGEESQVSLRFQEPGEGGMLEQEPSTHCDISIKNY